MATVRRILEPKMFSYIHEKLATNGLYQDAVAKKDARKVFGLAAACLVGVREVGGNNSGPLVELIQETVGGHSKEAWCMSFVQTCLAYAETVTGKKSPIPVSESCDYVFRNTPKEFHVKKYPAQYAIVVWIKPSGLGHTGVLEEFNSDEFTAFEGNTESGVKGGRVERDGGGVYHTERSFPGSNSFRVRGFLIPFSKEE